MKIGSEQEAVDLSPLSSGLNQITNTAGVFTYLAALAGKARLRAFALVMLPSSRQESLRESAVCGNMPDDFLEAYDATRPLKTAPIFTRLRGSTAPQRWTLEGPEETQPVAPSPENFDLFSRFGMESGLSVPLYGSDGSHALMCFFGASAPIDDHQMADLTLGSILAYDLYCALKAQPSAEMGKLSDREVQVLGWAANGKTSVEIATILSLSDHTVNSYLNSAMRKMDCVNRTQLVAKALRLRIIS